MNVFMRIVLLSLAMLAVLKPAYTVAAPTQIFWSVNQGPSTEETFFGNKIRRANPDGSGVTDLITGLSRPTGLAVAGGQLYWNDWNTRKTQRANFDGSGVTTLFTGLLTGLLGLAVDLASGRVFIGEGTPGADAVVRTNLDGTGRTVFTVTGFPGGVALDLANGHVYSANADEFPGPVGINRHNLDGTGFTNILALTTADRARGIALDLSASHIYFTENDFSMATGGSVKRVNFDGTGLVTLVSSLNFPHGIALDLAGGEMYWADILNGVIQRANLDGSSVTTLVSGINNPHGIALDLVPDLFPAATDDVADTNANQAKDITVLANDDVGDEPVMVSIPLKGETDGPVNGTTSQAGCTLKATCVVTYTPDAGFGGTDTFVYTLTDDDGDEDTATVTVTVDPLMAAVEASDDTVIVLTCADVDGCPSPFDASYPRIITRGTLRHACCETRGDPREFEEKGHGRTAYFNPRTLDLRAEIVMTDTEACDKVTDLIDEAAGLLVMDGVLSDPDELEINVEPWQRVSPALGLFSSPENREFLYTDSSMGGGSDFRAALKWGVCIFATDALEADGILFTNENAGKVVVSPVNCEEPDLPFQPLTSVTDLRPQQLDSKFLRPGTAECDGSRSGIRSSHVAYVLNTRIDTDINGPMSTVSRVLGHFEDEIAFEADPLTQTCFTTTNGTPIPIPPDHLNAMQAQLGAAKKEINAANKAVRRTGNPEAAFADSIELLDGLTLLALATPSCSTNWKALATGRAMNATWMACRYLQFPGGTDETQCLINQDILELIGAPGT
jgi:sugar lactone lactonase YvrE